MVIPTFRKDNPTGLLLGESARANRAFLVWLDDGRRSYAETARLLGKHPRKYERQLRRWSKDFVWSYRALLWDLRWGRVIFCDEHGRDLPRDAAVAMAWPHHADAV